MASPPTSTPRTRRPKAVAEPSTKPAAEPAAKPSAKPAAEPSAKSSAQPGTKPRARRAKPVAGALLAAPPEPALPEAPAAREALIRRRAYEIYERSGCIEGRDIDHWLAAEAEIDGRVLEGTAPAEREGDAPPLV
ncbi:MAG: DUF2934 domain-containing protein [Burkholderiaceae bacterium]|nr:DUF2934 domain-containing protein [Burkholderiaceae bacterium]